MQDSGNNIKVAITQPNFLPWLGYWDLLDSVDLWVSLDNVQNVKQSFIVRNRIKYSDYESKWLTVNLKKPYYPKKINEVELHRSDWHIDHLRKIKAYYREAKNFYEITPILEKLLVPAEVRLSDYNERMIRQIAKLIGVKFIFKKASDLSSCCFRNPQEMVLSICAKIGATDYYNFQSGVERSLYDASIFSEKGIQLFKQEYRHPQYSQVGNNFISNLSIIDLLYNEGIQKSIEIIRKGRKWVACDSQSDS